jgi:hypothetical protein
MLAKDI